ncbi:hypothetical protein G9A89_020098 [Geosiphon pyriformis]|nr:hypothetical protein G9A89_020098 [Geosiphon pyriformis]
MLPVVVSMPISFATGYPITKSAVETHQHIAHGFEESSRQDMKSKHLEKQKVATKIKATIQDYFEIALDEYRGVGELKQSIIASFSKSFENTSEREIFQKIQFIFLQLVNNIPVLPFNQNISEGSLVANVISPVLRTFFHNPAIHPTIWPNTASVSVKIQKLANNDPSRAKQPDMIGNVVSNSRFVYEVMFGEVMGEGKNNIEKKNAIDLIRLGVFIKDALDNILHKTGVKCAASHQWTGYIIVLIAPGIYVMVDAGYVELPRSFETCGMFFNGLDTLLTFQVAYEHTVKMVLEAIN